MLTKRREPDIIIIGGGIIGLCCAQEARKKFRSSRIIILESGKELFERQSGNNSGVLHSAIHCAPHTFKAILSQIGRTRLLGICKMLEVPVKKTGMMIVVAAKDFSGLACEAGSVVRLLLNARRFKIPLEFLSRKEITEREPNIQASCGLWLPDIWMVDQLALGRGLLSVLRNRDVEVHQGKPVTHIEKSGERWHVFSGTKEYSAQVIINVAGVYADDVAAMAGIYTYRVIPVRGEYYEVLGEGKELLRDTLVYPAIHGKSKGIHLMRTLSGQFKIGPNAKAWVGKDDDPIIQTPVSEFLAGAGAFMPKLLDLPPSCFRWSNAGIRATSSGGDMTIRRDLDLPVCITCFSDSPGLSAAPAIAERVVSLLG